MCFDIINRRPCLEIQSHKYQKHLINLDFVLVGKHFLQLIANTGQGNAKRVTSGIEIGNFNEHVNLILQIFNNNNENPTEVLKLKLNNTQTSYFHFEM